MVKVVCHSSIPATEMQLQTISKYSNLRKSHVTCFWYLHDIKRHWNLQSFYKKKKQPQLLLIKHLQPTHDKHNTSLTSSSNNEVLQFTTLNPTLPYL